MRARVAVPGSKSITNRALVLAALADGPSVIRGGLQARDSDLMIAGLQQLGCSITRGTDGSWEVVPGPVRGGTTIDCGLAGTVMRFLPPVAALADGPVGFDGDPAARVRPMATLLGALADLGADVHSPDGRLPFTIHGRGRLRGGRVVLDASASSQFVSGVMLSAARFDDGAEIRHQGAPVPSLPHIDMTVQMLREHDVEVDVDVADPRAARWRVQPGPIRARDRMVEPDLSNALPFLAAAMATGGSVTIPGWPRESTQPGVQLPRLLAAMGGRASLSDDGLTMQGPDRLTGLHADLRDVGELTPVLAALAALADSPSRLTGIAHLRGHETDRLAALATELSGCGSRVEELDDGLAIEPARLHGSPWRAYDDHRMATAGAVVGLLVPGIQVDDIATTAKTLPGFAEMWEQMLAPDGPEQS